MNRFGAGCCCGCPPFVAPPLAYCWDDCWQANNSLLRAGFSRSVAPPLPGSSGPPDDGIPTVCGLRVQHPFPYLPGSYTSGGDGTTMFLLEHRGGDRFGRIREGLPYVEVELKPLSFARTFNAGLPLEYTVYYKYPAVITIEVRDGKRVWRNTDTGPIGGPTDGSGGATLAMSVAESCPLRYQEKCFDGLYLEFETAVHILDAYGEDGVGPAQMTAGVVGPCAKTLTLPRLSVDSGLLPAGQTWSQWQCDGWLERYAASYYQTPVTTAWFDQIAVFGSSLRFNPLGLGAGQRLCPAAYSDTLGYYATANGYCPGPPLTAGSAYGSQQGATSPARSQRAAAAVTSPAVFPTTTFPVYAEA